MEVIIVTFLEAVASESVLTACNNDVKLSETPTVHFARLFDLATERERQLTRARAKLTTGLTNGRAANWAPEVEFSPFRALSLSSNDVHVLLLNQPHKLGQQS